MYISKKIIKMKTAFNINSEGISLDMGKSKIPFDQISHLEADINYTIIHLIDGKKRVSAFTLKKFDDVTQHPRFVRTHKSFIINTLCVKKYSKDNSSLTMNSNQTILISRRRKPILEKIMNRPD
jgi:two-component system, LytTR family, response regulator